MLVPDAYVFPGSWGHTRKWIIIHKTAGFRTAQDVGAYFQSGSGGLEVSSHYVIGQDGTEVQCVRETDGAGANGVLEAGHDPWWSAMLNPNLVTFSMEHVDPASDNSTPLTPAQKLTSFRRAKALCTAWNIPARPADANGGITGHYSIDPISRARCPGNYPWQELWDYLKGATHMPIPQGWTDDGKTLITPDKKFKVVSGFRQAIIGADSWDAGNVPLENEVATNQIELHVTPPVVGTRQLFRDDLLVWSAKGGVAFSAAGAEIKAAYDMMTALKAQLVQLQTKPATNNQQVADLTAKLAQIAALAKV